ncbi:MAG: NAD(P)H-binding protein [Sphingobacteriaceae bacterium]|nr:NAD(P)H-binding protein [Sphingobacteriaceae bacterium]
MNKNHHVILLGASGAIGKQVLQLLLHNEHVQKIYCIGRKPIEELHPKIQFYVGDMLQKETYALEIEKADILINCVGTTMAQVKGNKNLYRDIELGIASHSVRLAQQCSVSTYLLISSVGATLNSKNFYLNLKGQIEKQILDASFANRIFIRPSVLLNRGKDFRIGEKLAGLLMRFLGLFLFGNLRKYKAIDVNSVAKAAVYYSLHSNGYKCLHYQDLILE